MAWTPFLGIFFWLLIFGWFVFGIRAMFGPRHPWPDTGTHRMDQQKPSGLAVLDERYARGEMERAEKPAEKAGYFGSRHERLNPTPFTSLNLDFRSSLNSLPEPPGTAQTRKSRTRNSSPSSGFFVRLCALRCNTTMAVTRSFYE